MGRYDNTPDNNNPVSIALWKQDDCVEYKDVVFCDFEEAGEDANPQLKCVDADNGTVYLLYGAWTRNVSEMVRQFGTSVSNWSAGKLALAKNKRHVILSPVQKTIIEEPIKARGRA